MYYYTCTDTGFFARISDRPVEDSAYTRVKELPPDASHRWDGDKWVFPSIEELEAIAVEEKPTAPKARLVLDEKAELKITKDDTGDVRYYKNSTVNRGSEGIYLKKNGYLAFPRLSGVGDFEFIFKLDRDRYFTFGLAGDRYNWSSNSKNNLDLGVRFNKNRIYYLFGKGKTINLVNHLGYTQLEHGYYYRLRFNNSGRKNSLIELFRLRSGEQKDWNSGIRVWSTNAPDNFALSSQKITPIMCEYNNIKNQILAVRRY